VRLGAALNAARKAERAVDRSLDARALRPRIAPDRAPAAESPSERARGTAAKSPGAVRNRS
jgi:hypothetical protein